MENILTFNNSLSLLLLKHLLLSPSLNNLSNSFINLSNSLLNSLSSLLNSINNSPSSSPNLCLFLFLSFLNHFNNFSDLFFGDFIKVSLNGNTLNGRMISSRASLFSKSSLLHLPKKISIPVLTFFTHHVKMNKK